MKRRPVSRPRRAQAGSTVIELALSWVLFLTFFLGLLDFARLLFTWNAAHEAARAGARYAVVCDDTTRADQVRAHMQALLPQIQAIDVQWQPAACDPGSCTGVTVRIRDLNFSWISPVAGLAPLAPIALPEFATSLPREVMRRDPHSEALCGL